MPYTPVLGTLGFILSEDRRSVLMVHRNARPEDTAFGKFNGLGGKVEAGEDVASGMIREIREEAGIEVTEMALRGTISWPGFGRESESWFAFVFLITGWSGTPFTSNPEGTLAWAPLERLLAGELAMWEGDRLWIGMVFDGDQRLFHGVSPYDHLEVIAQGWKYVRL